MLPDLDRALLLGGLLALVSAFLLIRWGWQLLRAVWRRINLRRGLPYLKHSISSFGGLTLIALVGVVLGCFVCWADLTMRRTGVLDRDVVDVGRLVVRATGGRLDLSLDPAAGAAFPPGNVRLDGERWRLTGSLIQYTGLWRLAGIPDGYRVGRVEAASGPRGRPGDWQVEAATLLPRDSWFETLEGLAGRLPGMRSIPHATDWEEARDASMVLVVTPSGYAFFPDEERGAAEATERGR
jgi:hypothetical protein